MIRFSKTRNHRLKINYLLNVPFERRRGKSYCYTIDLFFRTAISRVANGNNEGGCKGII